MAGAEPLLAGAAQVRSVGDARERADNSAANVRPGSSIIGKWPEFANQQSVRRGADTCLSQSAAITDGVVVSRLPSRKKIGTSTRVMRENETSASRGHSAVTVKPLPLAQLARSSGV
jgi:hypothetical protein